MGRIFLSYKREPGFEQGRRDEVKKLLEEHYHGQHFIDFDTRVFTAGQPWREQIFNSVNAADFVLVLWSDPSDWVFMEVALASFLDKPYLFLSFNGRTPPSPFDQGHAIVLGYGDNLAAIMDKVYKGIDAALADKAAPAQAAPVTAAGPAQPLSLNWLRSALLDHLARFPAGQPLKEAFERPFVQGIDAEQLAQHERALVEDLLEGSFADLPPNSPTTYHIRYALGDFLGELKGMEGRLLELTEPVAVPGGRPVKALKHLVTSGLFAEFASEARLPNAPAPASIERYHPHLLSGLKAGELASQLDAFAIWLKRKLGLGYNATLRLPTRAEWIALAGPADQWTTEKLAQCNLRNAVNEQPRLAAVGAFRGGQAASGAYDLIGNAWELCLDDASRTPVVLAGFSFDDLSSNWPADDDLTRASRRIMGALPNLPIGFRFVVEES